MEALPLLPYMLVIVSPVRKGSRWEWAPVAGRKASKFRKVQEEASWDWGWEWGCVGGDIAAVGFGL